MIKIERLTPDAQATFQRDGADFQVQPNQLLNRSEFDTLVVTSGEVMVSIDELEIHYITSKSIHPTPQQLNAAEIAVDAVYTEEFKTMNPPAAPAPAAPVDAISTPVAEPVIVQPKKAG